jgi:hypothetical protein
MSSKMATTGANMKELFNYAKLNSISLQFNDENNNEIPIKNSSLPLVAKIKRNDYSNLKFNQINATQINFTQKQQQLMINSFSISNINSSVHIHLKPNNLTLAYLIVLKLNEYLIFNSTNQFIDYSQIMCPNSKSLTNDSFDSYYSFFLNMKQVNSYIGLTSFGIRELNQTEKMNYCKINQILMNNSFQSLPKTNELIFTDNFQLR